MPFKTNLLTVICFMPLLNLLEQIKTNATKGAAVLQFMNAKSPIGQHFLNATSPIGQKKSGSYCVQLIFSFDFSDQYETWHSRNSDQ